MSSLRPVLISLGASTFLVLASLGTQANSHVASKPAAAAGASARTPKPQASESPRRKASKPKGYPVTVLTDQEGRLRLHQTIPEAAVMQGAALRAQAHLDRGEISVQGEGTLGLSGGSTARNASRATSYAGRLAGHLDPLAAKVALHSIWPSLGASANIQAALTARSLEGLQASQGTVTIDLPAMIDLAVSQMHASLKGGGDFHRGTAQAHLDLTGSLVAADKLFDRLSLHVQHTAEGLHVHLELDVPEAHGLARRIRKVLANPSKVITRLTEKLAKDGVQVRRFTIIDLHAPKSGAPAAAERSSVAAAPAGPAPSPTGPTKTATLPTARTEPASPSTSGDVAPAASDGSTPEDTTSAAPSSGPAGLAVDLTLVGLGDGLERELTKVTGHRGVKADPYLAAFREILQTRLNEMHVEAKVDGQRLDLDAGSDLDGLDKMGLGFVDLVTAVLEKPPEGLTQLLDRQGLPTTFLQEITQRLQATRPALLEIYAGKNHSSMDASLDFSNGPKPEQGCHLKGSLQYDADLRHGWQVMQRHGLVYGETRALDLKVATSPSNLLLDFNLDYQGRWMESLRRLVRQVKLQLSAASPPKAEGADKPGEVTTVLAELEKVDLKKLDGLATWGENQWASWLQMSTSDLRPLLKSMSGATHHEAISLLSGAELRSTRRGRAGSSTVDLYFAGVQPEQRRRLLHLVLRSWLNQAGEITYRPASRPSDLLPPEASTSPIPVEARP